MSLGLRLHQKVEKAAQGNSLSRGISLLMVADLVRKPVAFLHRIASSSSLDKQQAGLVSNPEETLRHGETQFY